LPENEKVRHYKELKIWQKGMSLTKSVYQLTARLPAEERFGLSAQLRRAAVSVPSNIAEGQARSRTREFLQFLSHASGSLAELETQVLLSKELGYCRESETSPITDELSEIQKMIAAIRRKLVVYPSHPTLVTSHSKAGTRA
jgi:four helix bundle protein